MMSSAQKRERQLKYAQQLAEASNSPLYRDRKVGQEYQRSSERITNDDNYKETRGRSNTDDLNVISAIGQDSQQAKDRKKTQQREYAQQLLTQQHQKKQEDQKQGHSPYSSPKAPPNRPKDSPYGNSGRNSNRLNGSNDYVNCEVSSNNVMNFGPDPNAEAARIKEGKTAYARQLQEQQRIGQEAKNDTSYPDGSGSGSVSYRRDFNSSLSQVDRGYYDNEINEGEIERRSKGETVLSALELKRQQQRQYYNEITAAAAAPAITLQRGALKFNNIKDLPFNANSYSSNNDPGNCFKRLMKK
jgi:hypothetical protein